MLKTKLGTNSQINRIENSVQNILNLQSNLRAYLNSHAAQKEEFLLEPFINERVELISSNYKNISFIVKETDLNLYTNKAAFTRIVDNLLSNAAKYNKMNGKVIIYSTKDKLFIEDTGKGIKNPKRVFDRFYKEQDRGIGIGLHIVKKLCEELDISISLESEIGTGTTFKLNIHNLLKKA